MRDRAELELVIAAAAGDEAAFTELVRRYRDMLYGYCYSRTRSFEDARDLAQETFVRAYTSLGQLRDGSRFGPWLRSIAANICNRWSARVREIPTDEIEIPQPRESPNVALVREALDSLPDNERLVIALHYVDGLTYSDIADFLETSKSAVRGRLYRAREMLKAEVLRMTEETFGANRLDEEFVVSSVNAAIQEATNAYNMRGDKASSRKAVDEAAALIDRVAPEQMMDPVALGGALLAIGTREYVLDDVEKAHEYWERAKTRFEQAGDQGGIERWRAAIAYEKMKSGDLAASRDLYEQSGEYWAAQPSKMHVTEGLGFLAVARALESMGLGTEVEQVVDFHAGCGWLKREDGQTICEHWAHIGFTHDSYPYRLRFRPGPPIGPTPLPLVLIRNDPQVGDALRFVNQDGRAEESVMETLTETVTTPAGTFENCARASSRIFESNKWDGDPAAFRKLWFAPGVGIVRLSYQTAGHPADTSELVEFHVKTHSSDYLPLMVGNKWNWRWVEGEDELSFRTEAHREIVRERDDGWAMVQWVWGVRGSR